MNEKCRGSIKFYFNEKTLQRSHSVKENITEFKFFVINNYRHLR